MAARNSWKRRAPWIVGGVLGTRPLCLSCWSISGRRSSSCSSASAMSAPWTARSSAARPAPCSARPSSTATRSPTTRTARRFSPRCWRRSAPPGTASTWKPTSTGPATSRSEFIAALTERARAGVKVRVLADWAGSTRMKQSAVDALRAGGVQFPILPSAQLVQPGPGQQPHAPQAADRRWPGRLQRRRRHRRCVERHTPTIRALARHAVPRRGTGRTADAGDFRGQLADHHRRGPARPDYYPDVPAGGTLPVQAFASSPDGGSENMQLMYLLAINGARRSIDLEAAYFVPDEMTLQALGDALHRGVKVRLVVPGPLCRQPRGRRRVAGAVGRHAAGRRGDVPLAALAAAQQADGGGRLPDAGRLGQLRQPLVQAQRRGQHQHLRCRLRCTHDRR